MALSGVRGTAAAVRVVAADRGGVAVRSMVCIGVPLVVGLMVGEPQAGAAASFGGLAGLYVAQAPYRYRARVVAAVGGGLALAVLVGGLAASDGPAAALVAGAFAGVASFVCQAAELPPPRELMLVMAVLVAADLPGTVREVLGRAGLAAAGGMFAWVVTMTPALSGAGREPERRAAAGTFGAVAALLEAVGTREEPVARRAAITAVGRARAAVAQGGLPADHELVQVVMAAEALLEAALHVDVEAATPLDPGWARAVRDLLPAVSGGPVPEPAPPAAHGAGTDVLERALRDAWVRLRGAGPGPPHPAPPEQPVVRTQLRSGLRRHSVVLPAAARIGLAVAVGVGLGHALGLGHAYWVALTAAAVLQGSNLAVTRRRVVHRVAGTVVGVGLAFAVLGWGPPLWVVVLAAVVFQGLVELTIATHYGLAVVAITVLALTLFHIATPAENVGTAVGARLLDTGLGVTVALLLRLLLWPRATSARLPRVQARTVSAVRRVLAAAWGSDRTALTDERRRLQAELGTLRAVHADASADSGSSSRSVDVRWPVSVALEELAVLALSWPPHRTPPTTAEAAAFLPYLDGLAEAVATGRAPGVDVPELARLPRTSAAVAALAVAVQDAGRA